MEFYQETSNIFTKVINNEIVQQGIELIINNITNGCYLIGILICFIWLVNRAQNQDHYRIDKYKPLTTLNPIPDHEFSEFWTFKQFLVYVHNPKYSITNFYDNGIKYCEDDAWATGVWVGFRTPEDLKLYRKYLASWMAVICPSMDSKYPFCEHCRVNHAAYDANNKCYHPGVRCELYDFRLNNNPAKKDMQCKMLKKELR